jgi:hypothetical protein
VAGFSLFRVRLVPDGTIDASDRRHVAGLYAGITTASEADPCSTWTGPLALPMCKLRHLLASTSAFQTWVGAGDTTTALDSIYVAGADSRPDRPFVVIGLAEFAFRRIAGGSADWFRSEGALSVRFENDIDSGDVDDWEDAETAFLTDLAGVWSDAVDLSGSGAHISLDSIELADVTRNHQDDDAEFYKAKYLIRWSP